MKQQRKSIHLTALPDTPPLAADEFPDTFLPGVARAADYACERELYRDALRRAGRGVEGVL